MNFLFEVSWEVCNKVGGIYTVIRTKAPEAVKAFGENYFLLGPNLENKSFFRETQEDCWDQIRPALELTGLKCRLGRWQIEGQPKVILVDFQNRYKDDELLYNHWKDFGVDSYGSQWDYREPVLFSTACAEAIDIIYKTLAGENDSGLAHYHEWMCGGGLLYTRKKSPEIGTIFTTHATVLGRSMTGSGSDIYTNPDLIDPELKARTLNVRPKHSMEKTCAQTADCFTTVSDITSEEAEIMLGRVADPIVKNGMHIADVPHFKKDSKQILETRNHILTIARKLLAKDLPDNTRLWITSGRYEFRNKGYDIFLKALARLEKEISNDDSIPPVVAMFLIAASNDGVSEEAFLRLSDKEHETSGQTCLTTHRLHDEHNDPILHSCYSLNLRNKPENKVNVLLTSAYLDGRDGVFNLPYETILPAFDLGFFASLYEPWGYTPMEAVAYGVPAITTDLAGFGSWAQTLGDKFEKGLFIVPRKSRDENHVTQECYERLYNFARASEAETAQARAEARQIAASTDWSIFFKDYLQAYDIARLQTQKRLEQIKMGLPLDFAGIDGKSSGSPKPKLRPLSLASKLPKPLEALKALSKNMWWSWHPNAQHLFEKLDEHLWAAVRHNPVLFLKRLHPNKLEEVSKDSAFLADLDKVTSAFNSYMQADKATIPVSPAITKDNPVAYFSMEYGISECLPIYSGGLGVLSGDHLKSSSDLNIPLVAVGLFYKMGYFEQIIDAEGRQVEEYQYLNADTAPITLLLKENGERVFVKAPLPGRELLAQVWVVNTGRIKLYLMDTDIAENNGQDRGITHTLYGGDRINRIKQEILLGIGGVRLLEDHLKITPSIYHLNEGHSAFLLLERGRRFLKAGFNMMETREAVRNSSVFTTHTPVPAGNEAFDLELIEQYIKPFTYAQGLSWNQLVDLGHSADMEGKAPFSMTVLALKLTVIANGVAKLHGHVARQMWKDVWSGYPHSEAQIISVTNGIHLETWLGEPMRVLFQRSLPIEWDLNTHDPEIWKQVEAIPGKKLWAAHQEQKVELLEAIKHRISLNYSARRESPELMQKTLDRLRPEALVIGFARRFARYKRAGLIFRNLNRFIRLITQEGRPIVFLLAGKAHPADGAGKDLLQQIVKTTRDLRLEGRVIFLDNYDLELGRLLTQGVDVWLNTPRRPYEASGTSGMKLCCNGGLNISILDGWWDEAYTGDKGWAIRSGIESDDQDYQDALDNNALLDILESEVVPEFFDRDNKEALPMDWIARMKRVIMDFGTQFHTGRMVAEYYNNVYTPAAVHSQFLFKNKFNNLKILADWRSGINKKFSTVSFEKVMVKGLKGSEADSSKPIELEIWLDPGKLTTEELTVEFVYGPRDGEAILGRPVVIPLMHLGPAEDPKFQHFALTHTVSESGEYLFGIRTVPVSAYLRNIRETGLALWA